MRILGLDIGDKRIGIAVSDQLGITAQGLATLERSDREADIGHIQKIIADYAIETIVIGMPFRMDGSPGAQVEKVKSFASQLKEQIAQPVVLWDERLTSVAAGKALISGGMRRRSRKRVIDKVAASLILQSYLDSQRK